jgi:hypothetical protein
MYMHRMVRTQLYLDDDVHERLRALAEQQDRTVSDLVREAIARACGPGEIGRVRSFSVTSRSSNGAPNVARARQTRLAFSIADSIKMSRSTVAPITVHRERVGATDAPIPRLIAFQGDDASGHLIPVASGHELNLKGLISRSVGEFGI